MAQAEHSFHKKGVFSGASGVRSNNSAMGNWSWRQPLIIVLGGCTVGSGTRHRFLRRA